MKEQSLYFIMGTADSETESVEGVLAEALASGITHFQLREKGANALTGTHLLQLASNCKTLCSNFGVPFIVNDDVALCLAVNADGLHIGQEDGSVRLAREQIGPDRLLGVSVHSLEQAKQAIEEGADYLGIGPVFVTSSKADARPPAGVRVINEVSKAYPQIPIVGIGGITEENVQVVWESGARGVAVISAISRSVNRQQTIHHLVRKEVSRWS